MSNSFFVRGRKLVALAIAVPVLAMLAIFGSMAPASAWHPEISGKADCKGVVSFTVTSWDQGVKGTNTKIGVYYSLDEGKTFTPVTPIDGDKIVSASGVTYEFTLANGNKFSDSIQLQSPWPSKVTLKATSLGTWGGNWNEVSSRTTVVTVPDPCAKPTATISAPSCTTTDAIVTMKNTGGSPVEFAIYKDSATTAFKKVTLGASSTEVVKIAIEKETKLSVRAVGMANVEETVKPEADCNKPSATVTQKCVADGSGFDVVLKNEGKVEESFTVKKGSKVLATVKVAAGQSETRSYKFADLEMASGDKATITVVVDDKTIKTQEITNDCINSVADVVIACDKDGAVFTFTNKGKLTEKFHVTLNANETVQGSPVVVDPGKTQTYRLELNEDETGVVHVKAEVSGLVIDKEFTYDCVQVSPTTVVNTTTSTTSTTLPTEVLGQQVVRPQLAETGVTTTPLMILGGILMMLGVGFLQVRRSIALNRR